MDNPRMVAKQVSTKKSKVAWRWPRISSGLPQTLNYG